MRLCKDQLTGEKKPQNELYRAENGKYYTSEEAYLQYKENNEYRTRCTDLMYKLFGYEDFMKLPTLWYKKLKDWKGYGYKVVYETIVYQKDNIEWSIDHKEFDSDFAKLSYVSAIINNNLNDTLKKVKRREKDEKPVEIIDNTIELSSRRKETKDISQFLED